MKIFGKFIAVQLFTFLVCMYFMGGYIIIKNGDSAVGLNAFQFISGLIFLLITLVGGVILVCGAVLLIIIFLVWSFKNDDRGFIDFTKGIF